MIHKLVQVALRQRFLVLMLTVLLIIAGVISFKRMPVDAYPDLAPPTVELITQWPGHAAEEVERLITLPLEVEMSGAPKMVVMRSISLYGLSDIRLTFDEGTDNYFARQVDLPENWRRAASFRRNAQHGAAVQSQRPRLSLRA